ncbi:hypothetical protein Nepgr_002931 [Nepenthes gracilis]|uniref:DOG1 domain-containing protein n=1 Tax=Nepenthes gracilis TaxID=150966 RepID=A0AAD3P802_NEPGR|nr:hypothetical protein Nepgr_002931 [Nepenthes gracilis]
MSTTTIQFSNSRSMGLYEPRQQISTWSDASSMLQGDASLDDKMQRRLAQNREAAKKSRLRKKAYQTKQQGLYVGNALPTNLAFAGNVNPGIATFEMEYGHWLEEQHRQNCELRNALQATVSDIELRILVDGCLSHYYNLFRMKADATKADVFYLMSGIWRTSVERFFLWIGGFRPSEILNVLMPHLEPLTDQQVADISKLQRSSQQAEDALSQGLEKLQQTLAQIMRADEFGGEMYHSQIALAIEKLEALEGFVNQADHIREQALQLMSRILMPHQAARGLLALGEYLLRLRALSSLWAARPRDPA